LFVLYIVFLESPHNPSTQHDDNVKLTHCASPGAAFSGSTSAACSFITCQACCLSVVSVCV